MAIGRSQDPWDLSEKIIPHLEVLLKVDINVDKSECFGGARTVGHSRSR